MATISFSVADLFENAFGYRPMAFNIQNLPGKNTVASLGSKLLNTDVFGREYALPVSFSTKKINSVANSSEGPDGDPNLILKVPYALISISGQKNIVETSLVERRGSVKEQIGINDYDISLKGLIISPTNEFPEADIINLVNLYERKDQIYINSALTDIVLTTSDQGFMSVVIKEISFPEVRGINGVRAVEMKLISDSIVDLIKIPV